MTNEIGRLIDVDARNAWPHEARDFTPWLASHLDQLAEVIGVPLELQGTEVAVETFAADILARNPIDDSFVLIENQLEGTNHTHLGQIMTYLAGLEARIVVWIASDFQDAHLSAIKWLNEHTVDHFAFFAIKLRVVRIGDSLPAPVFDVLARPNEWERQVQAKAREVSELSEIGKFRRDGWQAFLERHPEDAELGLTPTAASSLWITLEPEHALNIALWIAKTSVGLFVRGPRGSDGSDLEPRLSPVAQEIEARVGARYGRTTGANFFTSQKSVDMTDRDNWPEAFDWLHQKARAYTETLSELVVRAGQ